MSPNEEELVIAANAAMADPNFRASVRQMHAENYPLVAMVDGIVAPVTTTALGKLTGHLLRLPRNLSKEEGAALNDALRAFVGTENLEARWWHEDRLDPVVLEHLRSRAAGCRSR